MEYEPVIGLEVHAQLKTQSKIFCGCSTKFGAEPNSQVCPVCLGMPGVLPVLNRRAQEFAIAIGLATHCDIRQFSLFARKNYFYPDLPKGYQISQFEEPICENGYVEIEFEGSSKRIGLIRIHLEEDAGKSIHAEDWIPEGKSLVDLNRCGTPLIEIVSAPDIRSPEEAYSYLTELKLILEYLDVSDCNMEQGSLRCDANISLRQKNSEKFGVKTELKNMNSFSGVRRALEFEIGRQKSLLDAGKEIAQETLFWDAKENRVQSMRSKEESHDYRYFPEPDLVAIKTDFALLEEIGSQISELPLERKRRLMSDYQLTENNAEVMTSSREIADFFEETCSLHKNFKLVCNIIQGSVLRYLSETGKSLSETRLTPGQLAGLLQMVDQGKISLNAAGKVLPEMAGTGATADELVDKHGLTQVSDSDQLLELVSQALRENPEEVKRYLDGKDQLIGFFVGQVMRLSKGKANPKVVNELLVGALKALRP